MEYLLWCINAFLVGVWSLSHTNPFPESVSSGYIEWDYIPRDFPPTSLPLSLSLYVIVIYSESVCVVMTISHLLLQLRRLPGHEGWHVGGQRST